MCACYLSQVVFALPFYHVNVDQELGTPCNELVTASFGPTKNITHITEMVLGILNAPSLRKWQHVPPFSPRSCVSRWPRRCMCRCVCVVCVVACSTRCGRSHFEADGRGLGCVRAPGGGVAEGSQVGCPTAMQRHAFPFSFPLGLHSHTGEQSVTTHGEKTTGDTQETHTHAQLYTMHATVRAWRCEALGSTVDRAATRRPNPRPRGS
jgi:hypothetical protein